MFAPKDEVPSTVPRRGQGFWATRPSPHLHPLPQSGAGRSLRPGVAFRLRWAEVQLWGAAGRGRARADSPRRTTQRRLPFACLSALAAALRRTPTFPQQHETGSRWTKRPFRGHLPTLCPSEPRGGDSEQRRHGGLGPGAHKSDNSEKRGGRLTLDLPGFALFSPGHGGSSHRWNGGEAPLLPLGFFWRSRPITAPTRLSYQRPEKPA